MLLVALGNVASVRFRYLFTLKTGNVVVTLSERLPVSEIEKDWNVVVPNGGFDYIYQVIAKRRDGEFCELALKGYKKLRYEADFIIESIEGTWDRS